MAFYDWTCDRISKLLSMRLNGFTAAQIGKALGTTRNSVIGKACRLGVSRPNSYSENGKLGGNAVKKNRANRTGHNYRFESTPPKLKRPGTFPAERPALHASVPVKFADLKYHHCRWPIGDPRMPDFRFCGAHRVSGTMYCEDHYEASIRRTGAYYDKD